VTHTVTSAGFVRIFFYLQLGGEPRKMELKTNLNVTWRYTLEDLHQTEQDQPFYLLCDPKTRSITVLTEDEVGGKGCPFPVGTILPMFSEENPGGIWADTTWERFGDGRVLVGQDIGNTNFNVLEKTGGETEHKLTVAEMPSHTHAVILATANYKAVNDEDRYFFSTTGSTTQQVQATGGNKAHNNLQPYITCVFWRRAT
jgi:hypothetical protein